MRFRRYIWLTVLGLFIAIIGARIVIFKRKNNVAVDKGSDIPLVQTVSVKTSNFTQEVAFTGTIRPANEVEIFARAPGRVEKYQVEVGDHVKKGQLLLVIEHQDLGWQEKAAKAAVRVARVNVDSARIEYERFEKLFEREAISKAELEGVELKKAMTQAQFEQATANAGLASQRVIDAHIKSPIEGIVTKRSINTGNEVNSQTPLFTIQDTRKLKIDATVDAATYSKIKLGEVAKVEVDSLLGEHFTGKISMLSPSLDAVSRRAAIEIELDNTKGKLLPNMFAHASLCVGKLQNVLLLPKEGVMDGAGGGIVYRIDGHKVTMVRPKLGPSDATHVVVESGLKPGEQVAVTGLSGLFDGAPVKVANQG